MERRKSGSGGYRCIGVCMAGAVPQQAQGPEENGRPEEEWEAELEENAQDEGDGRENGAEAFDKRVA